MRIWTWFYTKSVIFQKIFVKRFFLISGTKFYDKICLKYQKQTQTWCWTEERPFWISIVIYNSYSCYFCYVGAVLKSMLFFQIYCYQMKFPDVLIINLPQFFRYTWYTCHNHQSKYKHLPWNTLYTRCSVNNINNTFLIKRVFA